MEKEPGVSKRFHLASLTPDDTSICDDADSFLQSGFWGSFKARFGWEALAFRTVWESAGENLIEEKSLLALRRKLVPGFSLVYIPWGPELPDANLSSSHNLNFESTAKELAIALKKLLPKETAFIRFDLPWRIAGVCIATGRNISEADRAKAMPVPFIRSGADIQAPDTVVLDLSQPMDSIKAQMKSKWRYNAKLAEKKGVNISRAGKEKMGVFYELLKETARRDGISIHSYQYYETLYENTWYPGRKPDLRLYLAEHEGDALAGIMTIFLGKRAVYLYGASSNKKRNLMAPYGLQLKAMEDAKAFGCTEYDLYGIPPNENPKHPMAGLYRFKTGFGGIIVHRYGCWDYPCRPFAYWFFRNAERLRKKILNARKHLIKAKKQEEI